jgi:hypothetical protein
MANIELTPCEIGPWTAHTAATGQPEPENWRQVDPMVRGVWNMAQDIRSKRIVSLSDPWLAEFVRKMMETDEQVAYGDPWATLDSPLKEYFSDDGFGYLQYGHNDAVQRLRREGSTYGDKLGMGISVSLSAAKGDLPDNLHHIAGSLFDPSVHAAMIKRLGGRSIDLFTARPKGGQRLMLQEPTPQAFQYYRRLANTVYRRMSPGGLFFAEMPNGGHGSGHIWGRALDIWTQELNDQGISAETRRDDKRNVLVIEKAAHAKSLPNLSEDACYTDPPQYWDGSRLRCEGYMGSAALSDEEYAALFREQPSYWCTPQIKARIDFSAHA